MQPIRDMSEAVWYSFVQGLNTFVSFLPALLGALIILLIGWAVSSFLARVMEKGLRAVGLEHAVERSGIGNFIRRAGSGWTTSRVIAELVKWFIRLIFIQAAANVLGMPQVTAVITSIVLFIPKVIVAMAIIVIGSLIAQFLGGVVRGSVSEVGVGNPDFLATLTRYAVIGFAVIAAVNQVGIAPNVVNTLFVGLVGSIALAVGLAFGLGGREVASEITHSWYEGGKNMAEAARQRAGESQPRAPEEPYPPTDTLLVQPGRGVRRITPRRE